MSGTFLRILIAAVFIFHGIGQVMGIIPALRIFIFDNTNSTALKSWSSYSWLFTPRLGDAGSRILCLLLWGLSFIGFVSAALALMGWLLPHDLWRPLALVSATLSMLAVFSFWNALIMFFPHRIGNIFVNGAVLFCLLILSWPKEADLGF